MPKAGVVVGVLVAGEKAEEPLANDGEQVVADLAGLTSIAEDVGHGGRWAVTVCQGSPTSAIGVHSLPALDRACRSGAERVARRAIFRTRPQGPQVQKVQKPPARPFWTF